MPSAVRLSKSAGRFALGPTSTNYCEISPGIVVTYPQGVAGAGLARDTEGRSYFRARAILADPDYSLLEGSHIVVGARPVTFVVLLHEPVEREAVRETEPLGGPS